MKFFQNKPFNKLCAIKVAQNELKQAKMRFCVWHWHTKNVFLLKVQVYHKFTFQAFPQQTRENQGTNALVQCLARKMASAASFPPWNSSLLPKLYNLNEPCHPHLVDIDITKTLCWHHFVACRAETVGHQHHFCRYLSISSNFQRSKPNQKNSADFIHLASSKLFTFPHIPEHTTESESDRNEPASPSTVGPGGVVPAVRPLQFGKTNRIDDENSGVCFGKCNLKIGCSFSIKQDSKATWYHLKACKTHFRMIYRNSCLDGL